MKLKEVVRSKVLPVVNAVIRWTGLKVVPASSPNRDFPAFLQHVSEQGMRFNTLIDVGVAFGTPGLYDSLKGAALFLIEPVPSAAATLKGFELTHGAVTFNVAAGAEDGAIPFNVHDVISGSSALSQWEGEHMDGEQVVVPVRRLDHIIPAGFPRPCLLKVDTQGYELEVLAGASGILDQIDAIILEVSFHQFRKGAPEFNAIVAKMEALGFACYETLEGHYRAVDNAMAQVDLVFVPKDSPLRQERGYFSAEQAKRYLAA